MSQDNSRRWCYEAIYVTHYMSVSKWSWIDEFLISKGSLWLHQQKWKWPLVTQLSKFWNCLMWGVVPFYSKGVLANRFLVDIAKVAVELKEARPNFITKDEVERVVRLVLQQNAKSQSMQSRVGELKQHAIRHASSSTALDAFFAELTKIDTQWKNDSTPMWSLAWPTTSTPLWLAIMYTSRNRGHLGSMWLEFCTSSTSRANCANLKSITSELVTEWTFSTCEGQHYWLIGLEMHWSPYLGSTIKIMILIWSWWETTWVSLNLLYVKNE